MPEKPRRNARATPRVAVLLWQWFVARDLRHQGAVDSLISHHQVKSTCYNKKGRHRGIGDLKIEIWPLCWAGHSSWQAATDSPGI